MYFLRVGRIVHYCTISWVLEYYWLAIVLKSKTKSAFIPLIFPEVLWLLASFREVTRNKAKWGNGDIFSKLHPCGCSVRETDLYLRSCWVLAPKSRSDRLWARTGLLSYLCTSSMEERRCLASPQSSRGSEETCTPAGTAITFRHQAWLNHCMGNSASSSKWRSIKQKALKMIMQRPHWSILINCRLVIVNCV